jgi:hypothetical protein
MAMHMAMRCTSADNEVPLVRFVAELFRQNGWQIPVDHPA